MYNFIMEKYTIDVFFSNSRSKQYFDGQSVCDQRTILPLLK